MGVLVNLCAKWKCHYNFLSFYSWQGSAFSVLWEFSRFLFFFQLILWLTNKLLKSEKFNWAICFSSFKIFHFFTFTYKLKIKIKICFKANICSLLEQYVLDTCNDFEKSFFQLRSFRKTALFNPNLFACLAFPSTEFSWKTLDIIHFYHQFSVCLGWLLGKNNWEFHAELIQHWNSQTLLKLSILLSIQSWKTYISQRSLSLWPLPFLSSRID